ncbi:MAG: hypothetical protein ABH836_08630 [Candidatus Omnitrophota bacterium]
MKLKTAVLILTILAFFPSISFGENKISLKEYLEQALPPQEGRKVVVNESIGLITVTDTPSNHKLIKGLLKEIDMGPRQVMIEAKFVEVSVSNLNELGVEWDWYRAGSPKNGNRLSNLTAGGSPGYSDSDVISPSDGISWYNSATTDEDASAFPKTEHGLDWFFSKTTFKGDYLRAYLHALEETGKGNVLSAPKVTTLSGQMASMKATRTFPYVNDVDLENIGTSEHPIWTFDYSIEERTVGISLEVTPYAAEGSNYITLDIHPVVDTLISQSSIRPTVTNTITTSVEDTFADLSTGEEIIVTRNTSTNVELPGVPASVGWPEVESRSTQTSLIVKSGESIVLGGLIRSTEKMTKKRVPILGYIPVLGNLFSYKYVDKQKQNLLIFITATLINGEGKPVY